MLQSVGYKSADQALQEFLDSVFTTSHSTATVTGYKYAIISKSSGFRRFLKQRYDCDEIELYSKIKNGEIDVYQVLKNFVIFLDKANLKPNSVKHFFSGVKGYLIHLGIEVYSEKCKQLVKLPKIRRIRKEPLTKEIIVRILNIFSFKLRTVFLIATASGMRIGEIVVLKLSDIDFSDNPTKITIRAETTKTREERETFLTFEATQVVKDYLKRYFRWEENQPNSHLKDTKIFSSTSIGKFVRDPKRNEQRASVNLFEQLLHTQLKKIPEFNGQNPNGRRIIHFHALREYFFTTISNISGSSFAHALMGHHDYLDTYYTLSEKQKKKLYLKAEPYLTITNFAKVEEELERIQDRQKFLEEKYSKLIHHLKQKDPSYEEFIELIS